MKLSQYAVPVAMFAATAAAARCQYSLRYCASSLRALEVVAREGCSQDQNPDHYLFQCMGDNRLKFDSREYSPTGGCVEQGPEKSDSFQELATPLVKRICSNTSGGQDKQGSDTVKNKEKSCTGEKKAGSRVFRGQDVLEVLVEM
ncbi:MAG: hypothetical protein Q9195_006072 [Heterodermia aff. obscurata]